MGYSILGLWGYMEYQTYRIVILSMGDLQDPTDGAT